MNLFNHHYKDYSIIITLTIIILITLHFFALQSTFGRIDNNETILHDKYNIYWRKGNVTAKTDHQTKHYLKQQTTAEKKYTNCVNYHQALSGYVIIASTCIAVIGWKLDQCIKQKKGESS